MKLLDSGPLARDTDCPLDSCYLYCVVPASVSACAGSTGIAGNRVYAVTHGELSALVHDCPARPYSSAEGVAASVWVLEHHRVVEEAWVRHRNVLPLTFNSIVTSCGDGSARDRVTAWLASEHRALNVKLFDLNGKEEYGVQVFWDSARIAETRAGSDAEIQRLRAKALSMPPGTAYMYRQRIDALLRRGLEAWSASEFRRLYETIAGRVDRVNVESPKVGHTGLQMLLNLSCLVARDRFQDLKKELDEISQKESYSVRLVGPMPPYSFS